MTATNGFKALGPRAPFLGLHIAQKQQANPMPLSFAAHFWHETGGSEAWRHVLGGPAMLSLQWCEARGRARTVSPSPPPHSPWVLAGPSHSARAVSVLRKGHSKVGAGPELAYRTSRKSAMLWLPQDSGTSCDSACPWSSEVHLWTLGPGCSQKWRNGVEQRLLPQEERPMQTSGAWGDHRQGLTEGGALLPRGDSFFFPFFFLF